jgi:hypothetical protein
MDDDKAIDIREGEQGRWRLEFDYNPEFIAALKECVPPRSRLYDSIDHHWEIDSAYRDKVESLAKKSFRYVTRIFRRQGELVYLNLVSGQEEVQGGLFKP